MQELGAILRRLRVEKGLSQREAARRLGISASRLSDYEKGKSHGTNYPAHVPRPMLARIAKLYGYPLDNLLGIAGLPPAEVPPVPRPTEVEAEIREIVEIYDRLSEHDRALLYCVAKAFKSVTSD